MSVLTLSTAVPSLQLYFSGASLGSVSRDEVLWGVFHFIVSISSLLFDMIEVSPPQDLSYKDGHVQEQYTSPQSTASISDPSDPSDLLPLCRTVDDALADRNYRTLVRGKWSKDRVFGGGDRAIIGAYTCNDALCRDLFPKLVARDIFDECNGECWIHRYAFKLNTIVD